MRLRRILSEQNLLLLLSLLIATVAWYYVTTAVAPQAVRVTTKVVPVVPAVVGEPLYGYSLQGVQVAPPIVTLSGDPELLRQIDTVTTEAVVVTGANRNVIRDVRLVGPPEIVKTTRVKVSVQIVPAIQVTVVENVRVQVRNAPRGVLVRVEPVMVDVEVQGPVTVVSRLRATQLEAIVDGTDFTVGQRRIVPEVKAPPQVEVLSVRPAMVVVVVRKGS